MFKKIIIAVVVIMIALAIGWQAAIFGTRLIFSASECQWDDAYKFGDLFEPVITQTNWPKETTLDVQVKVNVNCAEEIQGGDYEIRDNELILKYKRNQCKVCTTCLCPHTLKYHFKNLPKKGYQLKVEKVIMEKPSFAFLVRSSVRSLVARGWEDTIRRFWLRSELRSWWQEFLLKK